MPHDLVMVGASHVSAPLAIRERLAASRYQQPELLRRLRSRLESGECFWLSTCNRSEVYAFGDPDRVIPEIRAFLIDRGQLSSDEAGAILTPRTGQACVDHLFRVAAGLDSLVVGEAQILGQIGQARRIARSVGTLGLATDVLLRDAVRIGRRARVETGIGRGAGSVSSAAVRLARRACGDLSDRTVLVVGAGEVAELVAQALVANGVGRSLMVNRTAHRAVRLASRFGGRAMPYERTPELIAQADVVICSTDAPHPIVRRQTLLERRIDDRPLCLIDLAVPRDVEPDVADLPGVHLYNVDDLQAVVDRDLGARGVEATRAVALVEDAAESYRRWLAGRRVSADVTAFRTRAHAIREAELARWESRLADLEPAERARVAALTRSIVNKILHPPTVGLKRAAAGPDGDGYRRALRDLFTLDEADGGET